MERTKLLCRKVNTRTHGVRHKTGGDWSSERNTKVQSEDQSRNGSMHADHRRGLDYTPLFRFLISRVGENWATIHSEAVARIDRPDPVFWLVARSEEEKKPVVRIGENSYFSGLYVDADNNLARVDPGLTADDLEPTCACCTHTFNGIPFTRPYQA